MTGSIGRTSKVPGDLVPFRDDGTPCDVDGCYENAAFEMVTESDSFGAETTHLCRVHYLAAKAAMAEERSKLNHCEVCGEEKHNCRETRDPDEGQAGPVYMVCPDCRKNWSDRISDELAEIGDTDPFPDDLLGIGPDDDLSDD